MNTLMVLNKSVILYERKMDNLTLLYKTIKGERRVACIHGFEIWIVRERLPES
jgi:hypothetical protein